jgi:hypothetical protein
VIIVFIGKLTAASKILKAIRQEHQGSVSHLCLSSCKFEQTRRTHIDLLSPAGSEWQIHFITNPQSSAELIKLREKGAVVCHEYGALSSLYKNLVIMHHDLMVSALSERPNHGVILAPEILTECVLKHRKNKESE